MKIVNLRQFLTMPSGTLFAKYHPDRGLDELGIKRTNADPIDFYYEEFLEVANSGSDDLNEIMERAETTGCNVVLEPDGAMGRDGFYDEKQLYAVFNYDDLRLLVNRLMDCMRRTTDPAFEKAFTDEKPEIQKEQQID